MRPDDLCALHADVSSTREECVQAVTTLLEVVGSVHFVRMARLCVRVWNVSTENDVLGVAPEWVGTRYKKKCC